MNIYLFVIFSILPFYQMPSQEVSLKIKSAHCLRDELEEKLISQFLKRNTKLPIILIWY